MDVWEIANEYAERALKFRLRVESGAPKTPQYVDEVLIHIQVPERLLSGLGHSGLPPALDVGLYVSPAWLRVPFPELRAASSRIVNSPDPESAELVLIADSFRVVESHPWPDDLNRRGITIDESQAIDLMERLEQINEANTADSPGHQIFGFAQRFQNDVWWMLRHDLERAGDSEALARLDKIEHRLFLQIDTDIEVGLEIGDIGRLFVLAPVDDIRNCEFKNALACVEME